MFSNSYLYIAAREAAQRSGTRAGNPDSMDALRLVRSRFDDPWPGDETLAPEGWPTRRGELRRILAWLNPLTLKARRKAKRKKAALSSPASQAGV